jgi:hypothetical protein
LNLKKRNRKIEIKNKKQEDQVMKTMSSRLRKAGMETIAILAVLIATCLTISAQGTKFENNELKSAVLALTETGKGMTTAEAETNVNAVLAAFAAYLVEEKETELETEEWMLNVDNFFMDYSLEEATEGKIEVETWMLEDSLFNKKDKTKAKEKTKSENESNVLAEVKTGTNKKAVGVTNSKTQFGRRAMILVEDEDPKLKMEQWMLDYRHWNLK